MRVTSYSWQAKVTGHTEGLQDLATAKQAWWTAFRPNLLTFVSDVANEWQTEQTAANGEWTTYSAAKSVAETGRVTATADAVRDARSHLAGAYETREQVLADVSGEEKVSGTNGTVVVLS